MNLPAEIYQEVVASLKSAVAQEPRPQDRRAPRVRASTLVAAAYWSAPDAPAMSMEIRDLSLGGIGLLHTQRLALDEQIVVFLPRQSAEAVPVLCSINYWEPIAENLYALGAQFLRIVSQDELSGEGALSEPEDSGVLTKITHAWERIVKRAS